MRVFVYGTLLSGLCRAAALKDATFLGAASTEGRLYNLGDYPGMLPGRGKVHGEVYQLDARTLDRLDGIEDYYPDCPESSLYLRRPVRVALLLDGCSLEADTYLYNAPIPESQRIAHGDYRRFLQQTGPAR